MLAEAAIERVLALDPEREEVMSELDGRRIRVVIDGEPPLRLSLCIDGAQVRVHAAGAGDADVEIRGRLSALLALLNRTGPAVPASLGVTVSGDITLLETVKRAASRLRPDWDEPLARLLGDAAARPVSGAIRALARFTRGTIKELGDTTAEYLREESGLLADAERVAEFAADVRHLRDAAERLDKRLTIIERRRNPSR